MNTNSENPKVGREFQEAVRRKLSADFGEELKSEISIPIGNPAKGHRFDCATEDHSIVVECKCYTWTDTGNIPVAKLTTLNEAVFFLGFLPRRSRKIIVINMATHPRRNETLAQYYCRINGHLLEGITIMEFRMEDDTIRTINAFKNREST